MGEFLNDDTAWTFDTVRAMSNRILAGKYTPDAREIRTLCVMLASLDGAVMALQDAVLELGGEVDPTWRALAWQALAPEGPPEPPRTPKRREPLPPAGG